jgi:hypothetical protein
MVCWQPCLPFNDPNYNNWRIFIISLNYAPRHEDVSGSGGIAPPFLTSAIDDGDCLERRIYISTRVDLTVLRVTLLKAGTVCPQSVFGVLKNCGAQTNWASYMRFAADHSETMSVFSLTDSKAAIFTFLSQLFVKWRLCRNSRIVWDGFLRQNQSPRLNEIPHTVQ